MKKFLLITAVFISIFTTAAYAGAKYNDSYYDTEVKAISGELMVGARSIFEAMGYTVNWDANTKSTVFSNDTNTIKLAAATGELELNGASVQFDAKSGIYDNVTYVPAKLLEKIGVEVQWDYEKNYPLFYSGDYKAVTTTEKTTEISTEETTEISTEAVSEESTEESTEAATTEDGWNKSKNEYYINGKRLTGLQYIDGKLYNFGTDGMLTTGIFTDESGVYGYDEYGNGYNGFLTYEGKKYYFENGKAYTVPTAIKGKMYNFASDGTLTIGWADSDGNKMYYNEFGYPVEGMVTIDGTEYIFAEGVMQTGQISYGENTYYANDDGSLVKDSFVNDYYYGLDGAGFKYSQGFKSLYDKSKTILSQIGTDTKAIYNYVVAHVSYKFMAQQDWTTMANTGFNTGRGACYNFAACVDILLKNAGYETRVVRGTGHYTSLHYWNQVYINGAWTNIDACNKYYNVSDQYLKSKTYTFDKYEYPVYR